MKRKNNASPRFRLGNKKDNNTKIKSGEAQQDQFLNFLINKIGDIEDVTISIEGGKRIPIKDIKKKIN